MSKRRMIIMVLVLLSSCRRGDWTWRGVDHPLTCAHSSGDEFHCVGDGRAYLCIRDTGAETMDCAPMPSGLVQP